MLQIIGRARIRLLTLAIHAPAEKGETSMHQTANGRWGTLPSQQLKRSTIHKLSPLGVQYLTIR